MWWRGLVVLTLQCYDEAPLVAGRGAVGIQTPQWVCPAFTGVTLQDSGEVLWTYTQETPFFSSPSGSAGCVVIGSVDGHICSFSDTGQLVSDFTLVLCANNQI